MRYPIVLALTFLLAAEVVGEDRPIPQDAAKIEKRRRDKLEYNRRTLQGAYDQVGKTSPKWDKPAREAFELAARSFCRDVDPGTATKEVCKLAKLAIDAGCDDPLLAYLHDRMSIESDDPEAEEVIRLRKVTTKDLANSRYPACRRAFALRRNAAAMLSRPLTDDSRREIRDNLDAALALLPESVAKDERNEFWEDTWFSILTGAINSYRLLGIDLQAAHKKVDVALAKIPELAALRSQIQGVIWNTIGWQARTEAFAPQVPAGGFEILEKSLIEARKAYERAWKIRPDDAQTATSLLDIDRAIGGDREAMELWFERAMKADGDARDACFTKLDWLDPKWHGTPEEMLAFGRRCRDTKNWRAGITLLFCDAQHRYTDMIEPSKRLSYLGLPEVWPEIAEVFEEYLKHYPSDAVVRSKYAAMCLLAHHSPEAHAQFEILGDRLTQWTDFPYYPLETMKLMRAQAKRTADFLSGEKAKADAKADRKTKP